MCTLALASERSWDELSETPGYGNEIALEHYKKEHVFLSFFLKSEADNRNG